jgi:hypothetical protein
VNPSRAGAPELYEELLLADGLWVLRGRLPDGGRVLRVHNPSANEAEFVPDELLPGADPLYFLGGAIRTSAGPAGRTVCHLEPRGHTCLVRIPPR